MYSTASAGVTAEAGVVARAAGGPARLRTAVASVLVMGLLAACGSAPSKPGDATSSGSASDAKADSLQKSAADGEASGGAGGRDGAAKGSTSSMAGGASSGTAGSSAPVDKRALADFERAVGLMRQGNTTDAELEFKQLATGYPQLTGAYINAALIQRKTDRLDEAEATLKSAVEKNPSSVLAWTELGLTQRMRGEFQSAAASYEKAIAADANYAPAHRNYAVLLDLYLGDPEHALTELERYKELTGEEKPVNSWIAELRQRTGKPAAPRPAAAPAQSAPAEGAPNTAEPASSEAPASAPPAKPAESPQPRAGATIARAELSPTWANPTSGKGA